MGYGEIEGQCGTCRFAAEFDYASSPSGPEDGVHCTSEDHAEYLEGHGVVGVKKQLEEYGFMDLFRIEAVAEESFRCPQWEPKPSEK